MAVAVLLVVLPAVAGTLASTRLDGPRAVALERPPAVVPLADEIAAPLAEEPPASTTTTVPSAPAPSPALPTTVPPPTTTTTTMAPTTTTTMPPAPVRTSVDFGGGLVAEVIAPPGPGPHPTLVFVHGGGWVSGDHLDLPEAFGVDVLPERGWAVASIGYRLASRDRGVDASHQVDDVVRVITWLRTDGHELDLGGRLVGLGHSAGGHLLLLAAATMDPRLAPDTVIGAAGIYDFGEDIQESPILAAVLPDALGCEPDECRPGWLEQLSPGTHADVTDPRVVLVHGDADRAVPVRTAVDLADTLAVRGVDASLVVVEGGDHYDTIGPAVRDALAAVLGV